MAIALVVAATPAGGINGVTTSGVDTSGANLLVCSIAFYAAAPTLTDSKFNTWNLRRTESVGASPENRLYDAVGSPNVGSGHTFSITTGGTGTFSAVGMFAFSGAAASPFDQVNSAQANGPTTLQPGSITPTANNAVVVTSLAWNPQAASVVGINGGFSSPAYVPPIGGSNFGLGLSYLIQTTATAANPTWSANSGMTPAAAIIASYKEATGTTYSVNVNESVALGDSQNATVTTPVVISGTVNESVALADVQNAIAVYNVSRAEVVTLTDSQDAAFPGILSGTVNESISLFDSCNAQLDAGLCPGLPPGWVMSRVLEHVPDPNFPGITAGPGFTRWTYITTDERGDFVCASGADTDCCAQAHAMAEQRTQQRPYNEAN